MRIKIIFVAAIIFIVAVGCKPQPASYSVVEGAMLGTSLRIVADAECTPEVIYSRAMQIDSTLKAEMSIFDSQSLISRINRGETTKLTAGLEYNLHLSDSVSRLSAGAYDVTVMPLVRAYGFAGDKAEQHPNIDSLLEFVGYEKISVKEGHLIRQDARTQIDLNSIAKGYTVDVVARALEELGAKNYLVDIGGEIHCRGVNKQGNPWRIGVESPIDGNMTNGEFIQKCLTIPPDSPYRAMATSGNYRRFYLNDQGERVSHTIDPRTGLSRHSTLLSVTVIAPTCALADAYSTMFMAVGDTEAINLAKRLTNCEVYFIFASKGDSYREYLSEGMRTLIL